MAWLRLIRAALAPTILWDFLAGLLLASPALARREAPPGEAWRVLEDPFQLRFLWPLAALLCAYHGGMALNDWVDRARDARDGRKRPLVDGSIAPPAGFFLAALLIGASTAITLLVLDGDARELGVLLIAAVLLYDFGGPLLRVHLGPPLLAICRSISLMLAPMWVLGMEGCANVIGPLPVLAYALYFLFLSRLAQREEQGLPGMRALPFVIMASLAPFVVLLDGQGSPVAAVFGLAIAAWLLVPCWPQRHAEWTPDFVQSTVRRSLVAAPLVPAMAVLAYPPAAGALWAVGGIVAAALATTLARRMNPA